MRNTIKCLAKSTVMTSTQFPSSIILVISFSNSNSTDEVE